MLAIRGDCWDCKFVNLTTYAGWTLFIANFSTHKLALPKIFNSLSGIQYVYAISLSLSPSTLVGCLCLTVYTTASS